MSDEQRVPVWSWRDAIRKATVPSLTKLVLYTLSTYLSDVGDGCYPSMRTLMADTGLSNKSLATHLQNAADAGMLAIRRTRKSDGTLGRNIYLPRFPDTCRLQTAPADMRPAHDEDEDDCLPLHQVKEIHLDALHQVKEIPSPGESGALHQVKEIHSVKNSIGNIQEKNSTPPLPPAKRGARASEIESILNDAIAERPERQRVIDIALRRLVTTRRLDAPSPPAAIRSIADWLMAEALPDDALAAVCEDLLERRGYSVKPSDIEAAIRAQAKAIANRATYNRPALDPPRDPVVSQRTSALLEALSRLVHADVMATVCNDLRIEEQRGEALTVSVGRQAARSMIDLSYAAQLRTAAQAVVPGVSEVWVEVRRPAAHRRAA